MPGLGIVCFQYRLFTSLCSMFPDVRHLRHDELQQPILFNPLKFFVKMKLKLLHMQSAHAGEGYKKKGIENISEKARPCTTAPSLLTNAS